MILTHYFSSIESMTFRKNHVINEAISSQDKKCQFYYVSNTDMFFIITIIFML